MAFDSTLPDPASTLSGGSNYANGITSLFGPPPAKPGESTFTANPYQASWRKANGVWDYQYEASPGVWQPIPDEVRRSKPNLYGLNAVSARRAQQVLDKNEETQARINTNAAGREARNFGLQQTVALGTLRNNSQSITNEGEQIRQAGIYQNRTLDLLEHKQQDDHDFRVAELLQQGKNTEAALLQHKHEFDVITGIQTEEMRRNNALLDRRLTMEDTHFQQQLEQDKRANRRAQVLGSLTLVAQSLARL